MRLWLYWLISMLVVFPAASDTIEIGGVLFHVDRYRPVEGDKVEVSVFGETKLLSESAAEQFVAERYLQAPGGLKRFRSQDLRALLSYAVEESRPAWFGALLEEILRSGISLQELEQELLHQISGSSIPLSFASQIDQLLEDVEFQQYLPVLFLAYAELHGAEEQMQQKFQTLSPQQQGAIKQYIQESFLRKVSEKDFQSAAQDVQRSERIFNSSDPFFLELRLSYQRAREISEIEESERLQQLLAPLRSEDSQHKVLQKVVTLLAVDAIHSMVKRLLENNSAEEALRMLSELPLTSRTPTTHELAARALGAVTAEGRGVLTEPKVSQFLIGIGRNDNRIQEQFSLALDKEFSRLLYEESIYKAVELLPIITSARPDPSLRNDQLRLDEAVAWSKLGRELDAEQALAARHSSIPIIGHLRLLLAGYYIHPNILLLIFILPILLGFSFYLYFRDAREKKEKQQIDLESDSSPYDPAEEHSPFGFAMANIPRALNPRMVEYISLLEDFELGPMATEQQIKAAYRRKIKEVHPDLNASQGAEEKNRFVELTSMYEKLVQLRRELKL